MSRKQNLLPKTCVGHARLLKTTATTTTTHAHAVTTHNHSVHLGDGQNSLLPGLKTPALVENFCSKLNRPATNQILLRTAKTSRDCRKLRKTAWYQRIFASHQLSSSDAHIFTPPFDGNIILSSSSSSLHVQVTFVTTTKQAQQPLFCISSC